jgi:hypothetical protein
MPENRPKHILARESLLFIGLLLIGIIAIPLGIFWIGPSVLGEFGGDGFGSFFGTLVASLRGGDLAAWFLVLSPYLGTQCLRLAWRALRPG